MSHPRRFRLLVAAGTALAGVAVFAAVRGCHGGQRLVEVFDNGPVGGPPGGSEGYRWVGKNDHPPPGKGWKTVDPELLTPEERERVP